VRPAGAIPQLPSLTGTQRQAEPPVASQDGALANDAARVTLGLASLLGAAALLLTLSSSAAAKAESSASLLTFDSPCRKILRTEVRGGVEKSNLQDRARLAPPHPFVLANLLPRPFPSLSAEDPAPLAAPKTGYGHGGKAPGDGHPSFEARAFLAQHHYRQVSPRGTRRALPQTCRHARACSRLTLLVRSLIKV
jgi:hypothetical protein